VNRVLVPANQGRVGRRWRCCHREVLGGSRERKAKK
jgi:hypothetical protein